MPNDYSEINKNSIVCDASSLISLAEACLLDSLTLLRQHMYGDFIYPKTVRFESIEYPVQKKEHALRALRLMDCEKSSTIKIIDVDVGQNMNEIMNTANNIFSAAGRPVRLVDAGEAAQLALSYQLGIKNILIDERTTRTLIEAPLKLKQHLENEFRKKVTVNEKMMDHFLGYAEHINIIRSSELIVMAYKYGYFDTFGEYKEKALESALYTLKFSGCSISFEEIEEMMREINAGAI